MAADVAMYRAKAAGKGMVESAPLEGHGVGRARGRVGVRQLRPIGTVRLDEGFKAG